MSFSRLKNALARKVESLSIAAGHSMALASTDAAFIAAVQRLNFPDERIENVTWYLGVADYDGRVGGPVNFGAPVGSKSTPLIAKTVKWILERLNDSDFTEKGLPVLECVFANFTDRYLKVASLAISANRRAALESRNAFLLREIFSALVSFSQSGNFVFDRAEQVIACMTKEMLDFKFSPDISWRERSIRVDHLQVGLTRSPDSIFGELTLSVLSTSLALTQDPNDLNLSLEASCSASLAQAVQQRAQAFEISLAADLSQLVPVRKVYARRFAATSIRDFPLIEPLLPGFTGEVWQEGQNALEAQFRTVRSLVETGRGVERTSAHAERAEHTLGQGH